MDSLGRRKTIMIGAIINLIGAVLQTAAQHLGMVLAGRIMAGWAVGLLSMSVPVYQSECAHPKKRGQRATVKLTCGRLHPTRFHRWYSSTNDRNWLYRLDLDRLWILQSTGYKFLLLAISPCIPMCALSTHHLRHNVLSRKSTVKLHLLHSGIVFDTM